MSRPTHEETADARADALRFLATHPTHELAPTLRTLLGRTAPPTQAEAIPAMIQHANEAGGWKPHEIDHERAIAGIEGTDRTSFGASVRAQWKTLVHFFGGAQE